MLWNRAPRVQGDASPIAGTFVRLSSRRSSVSAKMLSWKVAPLRDCLSNLNRFIHPHSSRLWRDRDILQHFREGQSRVIEGLWGFKARKNRMADGPMEKTRGR